MEYQYIATTKSGKLKKGSYETSSKEKVREFLQDQDLIIVSIHQSDNKSNITKGLLARNIRWGKSMLLDKIIFARHLSVMLRAGLSLTEALETIKEQTNSKKMIEIVTKITSNVNNGKTLAYGLEQYPDIFTGIFIGMVKVGEASGTLERNLEYVASELEKDYELRRKVRSAMLYPVIVLLATFVMGVGLTIFILPKVVNMFKTFRLELPLSTKIFLGIANILVNYGLFLLIGLVILVVIVRILIKAKATKPFFHKIYLNFPIIGKLVKNINLTRLCRALAVLLKSGITINEALTITSVAVENVHYQRILKDAMDNINRGKPLSISLTSDKLIPIMTTKMINVGEKTGKMEESLSYLADFYDAEVNNATKNLATVIEPVLLIVIGVILGFLAVSIISPIYQFTGSLSR